jgi:Tol biopolymer transport system component
MESVNPAAIAFDPVAERAGAVQVLTARTGVLRPSSVSPDGEWIALSNLGERQEDLFVMRRDGRDLRRLTDDLARDRGARFTPDGTALVFYSNRNGSYGAWSIRPDGSGLTRLTPDANHGFIYPTVSPADGTLSALSDLSTLEAFLLRPPFPATSDRIMLLRGTADAGGSLSPTLWSPDGSLLSGAWVSASGDPFGIGVYDVAAKRGRKLTSDAGLWTAPFLPDSRRLVYLTTRGELAVVDVGNGSRRIIPVTLPLPPGRESFAIAADGRTIYYGAERIESSVWKVELAKD